MAGLTAAQLVTLAGQIAKAPGFTSQAGQLLNMILQELCQDYDFQVNRASTTVTLSGGAGPYAFPADFLRVEQGAKGPEFFYTISGVPYRMIAVDQSEYDALVQTPGFNSYPTQYTVDMSVSPPQAYVWPPSSGAYVATLRYFKQQPDIATPESSATVPWFLNSNYLKTRLAGELMQLADDERGPAFLTEAENILRKYLVLKDDGETRTYNVTLDRRQFGSSFNRLPNTKTIGWGFLLCCLLPLAHGVVHLS